MHHLKSESFAMLSAQEFRTFFVTSATYRRRSIFKSQKMAALFLEVLQNNRKLNRCLLHEIVLMPDHFHLLITPAYEIPLERVMQFIKGGFSYRVKRELEFKREIWQPGFNEHRIKDSSDYAIHLGYIRNNPVPAGLAATPEMYPYCSTNPAIMTDDAPPGLKPFI